MIPIRAVEAAARELALCDGYTESSWASRANDPKYGHGYYANIARAILEAAAPHMLAGAFDHGRSVEHYTALGWTTKDALAQPVDKTDDNPYLNQEKL